MNAATGLTGETRKGIYFALGAYGIWGFAPIYFVWVSFAQPLEVLAHRVVWGVPFLGLLLLATGQWRDIAEHSRRAIGYLLVSALFLSINWLTFIYAIQTERIAAVSYTHLTLPTSG